MSLRFPTSLPALPLSNSHSTGAEKLSHGELLAGKITRIGADGVARINFDGVEVRARGEGLAGVGQRILAYVQKTRDEILLSLVPGARNGEILSGTAIRHAGSGLAARFGESELIVRQAPGAEIPSEGTRIRAQIQLIRAKPLLQMLPLAASEGEIAGTVASVRDDGTVLLDAGATSLIAESDGSAKAGEHVRARLLPLGDKWILQLIPIGEGAEPRPAGSIDNAAARLLFGPRIAGLLNALASGEIRIDDVARELLALLAQSLPQGSGRETWATALMRALEAILLDPQKGELARQLAAALQDSGLFLESRLSQAAISGQAGEGISDDLKLALLLAAQRISQGTRPPASEGGNTQARMSEISAKVNQLLDTVRAEQFQNLRLAPSNEFYIQLPFASGSGLESVEIHISSRDEKSPRKISARNATLMLAVTTSNLGRIKASASISHGKIGCRLNAERQSVVELLTANADALKKGLEKLNYEVTYIDCVLTKDRRELSIIEEIAAAPQKGLDVRA